MDVALCALFCDGKGHLSSSLLSIRDVTHDFDWASRPKYEESCQGESCNIGHTCVIYFLCILCSVVIWFRRKTRGYCTSQDVAYHVEYHVTRMLYVVVRSVMCCRYLSCEFAEFT